MTSVVAAVASGSTNSTLSQIEPGALGFLVVAAMGFALFFLLRNMNKQFRKIGPKPEDVNTAQAEHAGQDAKAQNAAKRS